MNPNAEKTSKKSYPEFANFGEYLYYAYANLQMLIYALNSGKPKYDRSCYMIRAKAFKAYKEGRWEINDLYKNNKWKMQGGNYCWYCGKQVASRDELTADHIFPRSKGGDSSLDNLALVCKSCNSSKNNMDLLEWYFERRDEFPMPYIFAHYYKQLYLYAKEHDLLDKHREDLEKMDLPFNINYIVLKFPEPNFFYVSADEETINAENPNEAQSKQCHE
jgi:hypothetical protein